MKVLAHFRRTGRLAGLALAGTLLALAATAAPSMGLLELPASAELRPVTVHYPSSSPARPLRHGPAVQDLAPNGTPVRGNGRLVVISHGTGGSPWVHADLARALVSAGFVVALPEHRGDTYRDASWQGTFESPNRRPLEVSLTIDAVARDPRLAPLLDLQQVGVYGMSAGGFTALTLAGGRWSPEQFVRHCDAHLAEDWQFCTGVFTSLDGGWLDGLKLWVARQEIHRRFDGDTTWRQHTDPRVAAIVAAVPAAAAFDLGSLQTPRVPLGLVTMGGDRWLLPRFHAEAVLAACAPRCERVAHLAAGGHGALLSPLPPGLDGVLGEMLNDPPGFDRAVLPAVDQRVVAFFGRHLLQ
jgi:predicted dienelactone hydrolase